VQNIYIALQNVHNHKKFIQPKFVYTNLVCRFACFSRSVVSIKVSITVSINVSIMVNNKVSIMVGIKVTIMVTILGSIKVSIMLSIKVRQNINKMKWMNHILACEIFTEA